MFAAETRQESQGIGEMTKDRVEWEFRKTEANIQEPVSEKWRFSPNSKQQFRLLLLPVTVRAFANPTSGLHHQFTSEGDEFGSEDGSMDLNWSALQL